MNLPPPPQGDDPIITQFKPVDRQWELNDENINRIDPTTGQTILHKYCQHINTTPLEVYRYLIETKGCDINLQDGYNDTPVHDAFCRFDPNAPGNITVLMYLLSQMNINANTRGCNGETLLHTVCENIKRLPLEIFRYLIETKGCDINVQDNKKDTPIHRAITYFRSTEDGGNITALTYLLSQNGINGNNKNNRGYTILHYACGNINHLPLDIFKVLIETMGCDVNARNNNKDTPLHHALKHSNPRNGRDITVWAYLINQNNVNINIQNEKGCNLLHLTCTNNLPSYKRSVERDAECDTIFCQIIEVIAERCVQQVLDENNPK
jgi:ankyrin repeat protein